MWGCEDEKMWRWADVKMSRCEDEQMWRCADVKMSSCEDEKMWRWEGVKMSRCEDEQMWRWADVKMLRWENEKRCEDEKVWRWADVKMRRCEDVNMCGCEDVKMRRCEDVRMWICADVKMWGCEDVKMRRCEVVKMRRCEDEKVRRWEDEKMWRWEDVKMWRWCEDEEDVKMRSCEDEKMWRWEAVKMRRWDTDPHYWKNPALRRSREKQGNCHTGKWQGKQDLFPWLKHESLGWKRLCVVQHKFLVSVDLRSPEHTTPFRVHFQTEHLWKHRPSPNVCSKWVAPRAAHPLPFHPISGTWANTPHDQQMDMLAIYKIYNLGLKPIMGGRPYWIALIYIDRELLVRYHWL